MAPIRECLRSAAIMKMKSRKQIEKNLCKNKTSNNEITSNSIDQENEIARNVLLDRFRHLRPVYIDDFEEAISFWIGDGQEQLCLKSTNTSGTHHYDSDSSNSEEDCS